MTAARALIHEHTSEAELQNWIIEYAHVHGWMVFAMKDSRQQWWGTDKGWPDLFMVRAGRALAAELKTMTGRGRAGQDEWQLALAMVPGVEAYLWTPADEEFIRKVLS